MNFAFAVQLAAISIFLLLGDVLAVWAQPTPPWKIGLRVILAYFVTTLRKDINFFKLAASN